MHAQAVAHGLADSPAHQAPEVFAADVAEFFAGLR